MSIYTDIIRAAGERHPYGSNKILKYTAESPYFRKAPPQNAAESRKYFDTDPQTSMGYRFWSSSSVDMDFILDAVKRRAALIPAVNAANGGWGAVYKYDPNKNDFSRNSASRPAHKLPSGIPFD